MLSSSNYIAKNLQSLEVYPKIVSMLDYIIVNSESELEDVRYKYSGPDVVRNEVIKQIIDELGFRYIADIMDTITDFQFNQLVEFLGLINLLKGSRVGLELVLKLLGFDSIITEWWEMDPKGEPDTFDIVVILNSSHVQDPYTTINKVKVFTRHYVYPIINNIDFRFSFTLAEKNVTLAGFINQNANGAILFRI